MFTSRTGLRWLLGLCLLLLTTFSTATAKKPPKDPPPSDPPPVQYHVRWLPSLIDAADAYDINSNGIIVGRSDGQAVCWLTPDDDVSVSSAYAVFDLNEFIPVELGLHLFKAERANNDGLITGVYENTSGGKGVFVYDLVLGDFFFSNPIATGEGNVFVKGINLEGTVVGTYRRDDGSFAGFAWKCPDLAPDGTDVYVFPEGYLATDINDDINEDGDVEVVGAIETKFYPNGDVFRWTLNWENLTSPAETAETIGLESEYFPGPVINNFGDIAASIFWRDRKNRGRTISLLESPSTEWTRLIRGVPWRIALNDQNQVACFTTPFEGFHHGSVIVQGTVWGLDNPEIIDDTSNLWFLDNAIPEAVADGSGATINGFSPIVGWHYNGRAFLLVPAEYTPPK